MKKAKRALVILAVLFGVAATVNGLHKREPHHIPPANAAFTYRVIHDDMFYDVALAVNDRAPREEWCGVLSRAATELDSAARDYMWKDSIYIEAYLETASGVSTAPLARFRRYIPIKNRETPWWVRMLDFPKDDKCTVVKN